MHPSSLPEVLRTSNTREPRARRFADRQITKSTGASTPTRTGTRTAALGLLATLLAAPLALAGAGAASADPGAAPSVSAADALDAQPGQLLDVRIGDVHPTQPSVGYDEIFYKLGRYSDLGKDAVNKRFGDWCEANGQLDAVAAEPGATLRDPASFTCELPVGGETAKSIAEMKTVVIGPGGALYLTDGHHTLTSLAETPDGGLDLHLRLRVVANLSDQSADQFWQTMIANKWTWLQQVDGTPIAPSALPQTVGLRSFTDDRYRSLLYFARDIGFASGTIPFQEFYWAAWVRDTQPVDLSTWDTNDHASYLQAVRALSERQVALDPSTVISVGFTASDLGVLSRWNDGKQESKGEWNKLVQPYSAAKPGKLAYAMAYKAQLPPVDPGADSDSDSGAGAGASADAGATADGDANAETGVDGGAGADPAAGAAATASADSGSAAGTAAGSGAGTAADSGAAGAAGAADGTPSAAAVEPGPAAAERAPQLASTGAAPALSVTLLGLALLGGAALALGARQPGASGSSRP